MALLVLCFGGCVSAPSVDHAELPYFAHLPLAWSGIEDGRTSFAGVFCDLLRSSAEPDYASAPCTDFLHLDAEWGSAGAGARIDPARPLKLIFVSGFLGDCLARYSTVFEDARALLRQQGLDEELLLLPGRASSAHNAVLVADRLRASDIQDGPPVVLIGYSKGVADIMEALALLGDEIDHLAAVVSIAGVVNGTPIADDQSNFMRAVIDRLPLGGCPASAEDEDAISSMTYVHRQAWLSRHPLPAGPHYYSIAAFGSLDEMSTVNRRSWQMLSRIDGRNDGQIIYRDALLPGSTLLAFVRSDHLAVALPIHPDDGMLANRALNRNDYPRTELLEALVISIQRRLGDQWYEQNQKPSNAQK
jgi:hypothetical protein